MGDKLLRKELVLGIIYLFIGSNFVSGTSIQLKNTTIPLITGRGNTLYVGGYEPENYSKIQDAIDDADNGDTVFVYDDSSPYYENLIINKSINLIGENKNTTIIDGMKHSYVIYLRADRISVKGFKIQNSSEDEGAVQIFLSDFNTITDNIITNNGAGIHAYDQSDGNTIIKNIIYSNIVGGILLNWYSNNNKIISNNFSDNGYFGLMLENGNNLTVTDNSFFNDGLFIRGYNNKIKNNTINGKPLLYFEDQSDKVINCEVGQIILVNCNNITVENQTLSYAYTGLQLLKTNNCTIRNNDILNIKYLGIDISYSDNNSIISNNFYSIDFVGLDLSYSNNNRIIGNFFSENDNGIYLNLCYNNTISGNTISNNDRCGLSIGKSSNNIITKNIIINSEFGIFGLSSNNNIIYHNNFISNYQNAYDDGENIWDNGNLSGGNFWDDYNGIDTDGDGIGDTPYPIPGGDNEDRYPLGNFQPGAPIIDGILHGKVGVKYEYNFSVSDQENHSIYLRVDWGNGISGPWQGPYDSDSIVKLNHTWNQKGTFIIKAQVKDIYDAESNWTSFEVTISKSKAINYKSLFLRQVEKIPILQRL